MNIDNTTSSSLDVSWDPVVDATSYDVSWSESGSSVVLDSQSVNDNAVTLSQLSPHTTYVVTVTSKGTNSKLLAEGSVSGMTDGGSKSMWEFFYCYSMLLIPVSFLGLVPSTSMTCTVRVNN